MKTPELKRLILEEFPEQQEWIEKLIEPINLFFQTVVNALNKQITFGDNIDCEFYEQRLSGSYPVDLVWSRKAPPRAAWIAYARETAGEHTTFTSALYLDWEFTSEGLFRVNSVVNLGDTDAIPFNVRIIAITG
jgi:hypothetical protein